MLKLTLLLGIKESYFFSRNLYGLWQHPFLTLNRIKKEKDKSQALLLAFFAVSPLAIAGLISIIFWIAARFLPTFSPYFKTTFLVFLITSFFIFLFLTGWISYWIFKIKKTP